MFPAARKGDPITHDMLVPCGVIGPPISGPSPIVKGSMTVLIPGMSAARWAPSGDVGAGGVFLGDPKLTPMRRVLMSG